MALVVWSVSGVPSGLVGVRRTIVTVRDRTEQNRTVLVSDVYWLHSAKKEYVMKGLSLDRV